MISVALLEGMQHPPAGPRQESGARSWKVGAGEPPSEERGAAAHLLQLCPAEL